MGFGTKQELQGFPGLEGIKEMVRDFRDVVPDFEMERKATILHEDAVIVLSKMSGTIQNIGKIYDGQKENEISFLPGIPAEKFMGKRFETMHLAVHCIRMARSNKIITLKIGPQLFTKCSTTDQLLTLDLRETLLISKCSIFIIMILIMF